MAKMSADLIRELQEVVGDTELPIPPEALTLRQVAAEMDLTTEGAAYRLNKLVDQGKWAKGKRKVVMYFWPIVGKGKK